MSHAQGIKFNILAPHSKFYQGPFGRICPQLDAWTPNGIADCDLDKFFAGFANKHMVELPGSTPAEIAKDDSLRKDLDAKFDSNIPAGYTYFGQFIDHDITFDPASSLQRRNDPNGLLNFRTPRLDLDNVYGRGRGDQPYLYDNTDNSKLLIGEVKGRNVKLRDLPRNGPSPQGRALIGDMRNDENAMVSQLQLGFMLAHNTLVDRARAKGKKDPFEAARKTLRWLYQWIVWNDFIVRIVHDETYKCALKLVNACGGLKKWELGLSEVYRWKHNPFIPVEFSVAAYRFGHSMVRNSYQTNDPHRGFNKFVPIFDNTLGSTGDNLRGFRPMLPENVIQWDWFLEMASSGGPFPQRARKIDTKLANALSFLHENPHDPDSLDNKLAYRNLKRGWTFGLPSGTAMAKKYCLKPIKLKEHEVDSLWYYILREAEALRGKNSGQMLGRLGSTIISATFAGLLKGDPCSYFNQEPCWTPNDDDLLCPDHDNKDSNDNKVWTLAAIIRIAGLPVSREDVEEQTKGVFPDTVSCVE